MFWFALSLLFSCAVSNGMDLFDQNKGFSLYDIQEASAAEQKHFLNDSPNYYGGQITCGEKPILYLTTYSYSHYRGSPKQTRMDCRSDKVNDLSSDLRSSLAPKLQALKDRVSEVILKVRYKEPDQSSSQSTVVVTEVLVKIGIIDDKQLTPLKLEDLKEENKSTEQKIQEDLTQLLKKVDDKQNNTTFFVKGCYVVGIALFFTILYYSCFNKISFL